MYHNISLQTELELFVRITDDDAGFDDLVDTFIIPFDRQQRPDSTFGPPITQSGSCGIGTSISISINITSTPGKLRTGSKNSMLKMLESFIMVDR